MCKLCLWLLLLSAGCRAAASSPAPLTIDGNLDDAYWRPIGAHRLIASEPGVPAELGGEVRAGMRGGSLCLAAKLPEPGGKVLARSIGRNPVWEKDALESPELEDRVRFRLNGRERNLTVEVNPWGAYRIEENGQVVPDAAFFRAARVTAEGWTVEAAVPVSLLGPGSVEVNFERIRSRRPLAPEFRWQWPAAGAFTTIPASAGAGAEAPEERPPVLGNTDPPLEVGRVAQVPRVVADWGDPAWRDVPEFVLARNEAYPRAPRHPTRVKWVHDGRTLALFLRMEEPEPVVAGAGGRDSGVTGDDHVAVYLATSGSAFLEVAVNPAGAIRDSRGIGPRIGRPQTGWNAAVMARADIRHGHWVARVDIPLDQCAAALGETGVPPEWRVLLARHRAARPGETAEWSALPVVGGSSSFYGPVRYRRMVLRDVDPASARVPVPEYSRPPLQGLAGELAALEGAAWTALERRYRAVRRMVDRYLASKVEETVLAERKAWEQVRTRQDWERFRDERLRGLRESVGRFPPERPLLDARVAARHEGKGYRLENVVFQSRTGFWITANLYLPAQPPARMPAIVIVHSQHYPKTQGELHDMGALWARTGSAVLVMERPGYGERVETTPWFRQSYASRFTFTKQLFLVGESYSGWAAWDVIRSVDYLYERTDIDRKRIILLGSVAGGGEIAGVAAALDERISAVAPFNYDQGHVRVHGDSPGQIAKQFSPWLVAASVAPRRFVRAFEFGWEGAEEPDYPNLWVDGMQRSEKVWGFYGAAANLASAQAYGLIRLSMERASHCFSIGPQQREELYPLLKTWFGIPYPSPEDRAILPDSQLSVSAERDEARRQEAERRRPHAELLSMPPAVSAQLARKGMHRIAFEMGERQLQAARAGSRSLRPEERARRLREELRPMLGDIEPVAPGAVMAWKRTLDGAEAEAYVLTVEEGIRVPVILLKPRRAGRLPVVTAVGQGGKERFLDSRAKELAVLLRSGIAVCLADVRGTGETAPAAGPGAGAYHRLAEMEFDLGRNLLGSRLKDLRTVLRWLRERPDIDTGRMALWGDSFTPGNPDPLFLDEVEYEGGPQVQYGADPSGAHLALLGALYEGDVRAVAARGGLAGYLSVLDEPFTYVPADVIVLGILKAGDIADIAGALAPRPLSLDAFVNGRNIRLGADGLGRMLAPAREAFSAVGAADRLRIGSEPRDVSAWLEIALR